MADENLYTFENPDYKKTYWHTCSHVLAQAMKRLHPEVKLAIGPAIENGFYYDFDTPEPFSETQLAELEAAAKASAAAPAEEKKEPEYITIDDFNKVKFVTAKILACEAVKKSKKLLCFTLDCGEGKPRQILSGIHEYYEPEELVGKTVVACTNLAPRKMMGLESNGMLISAVKEEPDGSEKLHLIMLDDKVPAGYGLC